MVHIMLSPPRIQGVLFDDKKEDHKWQGGRMSPPPKAGIERVKLASDGNCVGLRWQKCKGVVKTTYLFKEPMENFDFWTHYRVQGAPPENIKIFSSDPFFGPKNQNGQNDVFGPRRERRLQLQFEERVRRERINFQMTRCVTKNVTNVTLGGSGNPPIM